MRTGPFCIVGNFASCDTKSASCKKMRSRKEEVWRSGARAALDAGISQSARVSWVHHGRTDGVCFYQGGKRNVFK